MKITLLAESGLSYDRLANFLAVVDAGGIAKAADHDSSRQALYSRQISELETFFRCDLVRRKGRGIEITEEGLELARLARLHFASLQDFKDRKGERRLPVRIASGNSLIEWVLLPLVPEWNAAFPEIRPVLIDRIAKDIIEDLRESKTDFGIIRESRVPADLASEVLFETRPILYVPKSLFAKKPRGRLESWIGSLPLALQLGGTVFHDFEQAAKAKGVELDILCQTASYAHSLRLLEKGHAATILPSYVSRIPSTADHHSIEIPWLRQHAETLALAWNPKADRTKPHLLRIREGVIESIRQSRARARE